MQSSKPFDHWVKRSNPEVYSVYICDNPEISVRYYLHLGGDKVDLNSASLEDKLLARLDPEFRTKHVDVLPEIGSVFRKHTELMKDKGELLSPEQRHTTFRIDKLDPH